MPRASRRRLRLACGIVAALAAARSAGATWSIVAVDPRTGEVGVAGASCIAGVDVIAGLAPGRGAIAAQAISSAEARVRGVELLAAGERPQAVIDAITSEGFDPGSFLSFTSGARVRQYGVVALGMEPGSASYTGDRTFSWAGAAQGVGVAVQGNLLAGPGVVSAAFAAYEAARADCTLLLHDRLLAALEAGAAAGGDKRCVPELAALSAFVAVAAPDDPPGSPSFRMVVDQPYEPDTGVLTFLLQLVRPEQGGPDENPVRKLRAEYDAWRGEHEPVGRCNEGEDR